MTRSLRRQSLVMWIVLAPLCLIIAIAAILWKPVRGFQEKPGAVREVAR